MINELNIFDYKCFENQTFKFRNLNVFCGLNGSGKSTLMQLLFLILNITKEKTVLSYDDLHISKGEELVNFDSEVSCPKIDFVIEGNKNSISINCNNDNHFVELIMNGVLAENYIENISANRISPDWFYPQFSSNNTHIGKYGEYSIAYMENLAQIEKGFADFDIYFADLIRKNEMKGKFISVFDQVNAFIKAISPNVIIKTNRLIDTNKVNIKYTYSNLNMDINPFNVGYGITNGLPVVLALLKAKPGQYVFLENPENNIHPRGQRMIGELISYVASKGVQVFLETHSDHIINGIRVRVNDGSFSKDDCIVYYFERKKSVSVVKTIKMNEKGRFDDMPSGFMDEWELSLEDLLGF